MAFGVDNVGKLTIQWHNNVFGQSFLNVLHYRGYEGTGTDAELEAMLAALVSGAMITAMLDVLSEETWLAKLTFQKIAPTVEFSHEVTYGTNEHAGQTTPSGLDTSTAAACLIRKNFIAGRRGIGRTFFGPLPQAYTDSSRLIQDPGVGYGDLATVLAEMQNPITYAGGGKSMRPIVCNAAGSGVTSVNDVRTQVWSLLIAQVHSRKVGVGM